ncbi:MAG: SPFH domain-containing protein [Acidimicrobiia bacterium]|nr:SPFH domain-containing protein [Acidimicrobiia bacterium]MDH5244677.1 SPFH domain-containing protein [Chloroflexota bacterium]
MGGTVGFLLWAALVISVLLVATIMLTGYEQIASWEHAIIQRGKNLRVVKGPALVTYWRGVETFDKRSVAEHRYDATVISATTLDGKRGVVDLTIVFSITDVLAAPDAEKLQPLLTSVAEATVRREALKYTFDDLRATNPLQAALLFDLNVVAGARGSRVSDVIVRRFGQQSDQEAYMTQIGKGAKGLGAEGLYLRYLETLNDLAKGPANKIVVPVEFPTGPEALLRSLGEDDATPTS